MNDKQAEHELATRSDPSPPAMPPPTALARVGRVLIGTVGFGMIGTSLCGIIGLALDHAKDPDWIWGIVVASFFGITGAVFARLAVRRRRPERPSAPSIASPALAHAIKQRMLAVASQYRGRITAAELSAALGIEQGPSVQVLEAAARTGEARMLFSPEGIAVFEFPGLLAHKEDAKEPWEL